MQTRRPRVEVITEAEASPQDQLRRRQFQYLGLMLLRVICLIVAAILVSLHVPYALAWVLVLTVGMVLFPWMAVMVANDRPPRTESRFTTRLRRVPVAGRALPGRSSEERAGPTGHDAAGEPPGAGRGRPAPPELPPSATVIDTDV